jgi:signal transduction histidine kinase
MYGVDHKNEIMAIKDITENTSVIISSLLSLSRYKNYKFDKIEVQKLISASVDLLKYEKDLTGIDIKISNLSTFQISGNFNDLKSVLKEILSNSVDSLENIEKKSINIGTVDNTDSVKIIIEDKGSGIREDDLVKLFTPFYTTKGSISEKLGDNYGLGLSKSKKMVEESGGTIEVESELGKGTRVLISLPKIKREK